MNKYETVFILNTKIDDEQKRNVLNKIEEYIVTNAKMTDIQNIGVKKLAYDIKGEMLGDYYWINFLANDTFVNKLEKFYKKTAEILKFIVVRKEGLENE